MLEHIELLGEGVLAEYEPSWVDKVDEKYLNDHNYYHAWAIEPLLLMYNTKHYTSKESEVTATKHLAPTDWNDLASKFKNKYNVFKPSSGTGLAFYASILQNFRDDNGEHGISEEGWELLTNVIRNGIMDRGQWMNNLAAIANSNAPISMSWAGAANVIEDAYNVELDYVDFEEGVPYVVSQIAVVDSKNTKRLNASKAFVEWWGTKEVQIEWAKISGQAPANVDALELVDDNIKRYLSAPELEMDWEFVSSHVSDWRQKIELDII